MKHTSTGERGIHEDRQKCVCVCVAMSALSLSQLTSASADQFAAGGCDVHAYGVDYTGANRLFYFSVSPTLWQLDYTTYSFGPSKAGSDQNNQNMEFFGPNEYDQPSSDNLVRDGQFHRGLDILPHHVVYGTKGHSHANFIDIFDSTKDDPRCTAVTNAF